MALSNLFGWDKKKLHLLVAHPTNQRRAVQVISQKKSQQLAAALVALGISSKFGYTIPQRV